ncbi:hypothetical protein HF086_011008 [Spodoptera exigua]|uniref:Carboxylesterase type B domain-containing protein n=1 Tax=Spodoptera exigua TaxID=7107 RepID=A0A922MTX9_SPOEX|nr:hypothetical protein HF086_011008 [Spodoptera exigua]
MANGLYHKVIAQSGNSIADIYMIDDDPIEKAIKIAENLDQEIEDERSLYEFLVQVPIQDLIVAFSVAEIGRPASVINAYLLPVVEKEFPGVERFFDEFPRIDFPLQRFTKVPVMTGMNSHEGALFLQKDEDGHVEFENDYHYFIPKFLHIPKEDERTAEIEKKIKKFYFNNLEVDQSLKEQYINMVSDTFFQFPIMLWPEILSKSDCEVYMYKFQYSGNLNTRIMKALGISGASHGDMIQYQFYRETKHEKADHTDMKIIKMLAEAWCSFARNG